MSFSAGERIGHYEIVGSLGAGGMGEVFKARDVRLDRLVALKFPRHAFAQKLLREAKLASAIGHHSVCKLLDLGEHQAGNFIVFEFLEGETLAQRLSRGALPPFEAIETTLEILGAVAAMHGHGLVHGDLKPSNVMLTGDGVRVLDFGLARLLSDRPIGAEDATRDFPTVSAPVLAGTPGYMAPEQVGGCKATPLSDLFAVGAILFEMMTGQAAFPGPTPHARLIAVLNRVPASLAGSEQLTRFDAVVRRALAVTPAARFVSASEFAEALRAADRQTPHSELTRPAHAARILVLPFRALREDTDSQFLAQMLPDAISAELTRVKGLQVRSSIIGGRYGATPTDFRAIAAEAEVDFIVTGTLLHWENQVRVSAHLLQIPVGTIVATVELRAPMDHLFDLQDKALREIVSALDRHFGMATHAIANAHIPQTGPGYELYLRANLAAQDRGRLSEAQRLYTECLNVDPNYAPAWARLGRVYRLMAKYVELPAENMRGARESMNRALALSPTLDLAHSFYAQLETDDGQPVSALVRLLRMARENPTSSEVFVGLTYACRFCGLFEESILCHKRARTLDPTTSTSVTHTYFHMGDYRHCLETYSGDIGYVDALALAALGYVEEALERILERLSASGLVPLALRYLQSLKALLLGDADGCRNEARSAVADYYCGPEERFYFARQMIKSGHITEGFAELERAVRAGYFVGETLRCDPWLASIRGLSAFSALVETAEKRSAETRRIFTDGGVVNRPA